MKPQAFYDLLLDYAARAEPVREVVLGLVWTYCEADALGVAMSPGCYTRTLPWAGQLCSKSLAELSTWVRDFDPHRASVGMAAVNAALNAARPRLEGILLPHGAQRDNNLAVFEHFLPQLHGKRVVVIGRYPGLSEFAERHALTLTILERTPGPGDLPDSACEYLLPEAEWVFITASSLINKTFPRLAELSRQAITVLMGPSTPWLPELYHFGIDYLAGVEVVSPASLKATIREGGGVRLFDESVRYRVVALTSQATQAWTRALLAATVQERQQLLSDMADWYEQTPTQRYPRKAYIDGVDRRLSRLDSCFKALWDEAASPSANRHAHS